MNRTSRLDTRIRYIRNISRVTRNPIRIEYTIEFVIEREQGYALFLYIRLKNGRDRSPVKQFFFPPSSFFFFFPSNQIRQPKKHSLWSNPFDSFDPPFFRFPFFPVFDGRHSIPARLELPFALEKRRLREAEGGREGSFARIRRHRGCTRFQRIVG